MILFLFPCSILIAAMAVFYLSPIGEDELRQRIGTMQIFKAPIGSAYAGLFICLFIAAVMLCIGHGAAALVPSGGIALLGLVGTYYTRQYRIITNCHQVTIVGFTRQHFNMGDIAEMEMEDARYSHGLRIRLYDGRRFFISNKVVEYDALVGILVNAVKPVEQ